MSGVRGGMAMGSADIEVVSTRHLDIEHFPLDSAVADDIRNCPSCWGLGQAAIPLVGFFVVLIPLAVLVHALDLPGVVFSLVAYGCQATLIVAAARPALRGGRGWA